MPSSSSQENTAIAVTLPITAENITEETADRASWSCRKADVKSRQPYGSVVDPLS